MYYMISYIEIDAKDKVYYRTYRDLVHVNRTALQDILVQSELHRSNYEGRSPHHWIILKVVIDDEEIIVTIERADIQARVYHN